jgi:hypothetical protein
MTVLALCAVLVLFGCQYVVFAAVGRQEVRRRFEEAIAAAELLVQRCETEETPEALEPREAA